MVIFKSLVVVTGELLSQATVVQLVREISNTIIRTSSTVLPCGFHLVFAFQTIGMQSIHDCYTCRYRCSEVFCPVKKKDWTILIL
jgi:hypothetical protein